MELWPVQSPANADGRWRSAKAPPDLNLARLHYRLPADRNGRERFDPSYIEGLVLRQDIYGYLACLISFRIAEMRGLVDWQHSAARGVVRCLPGACLNPYVFPHWKALASATCSVLHLLPNCTSVDIDLAIVEEMVESATPYMMGSSLDPLVAYLRVRCAPDQASLLVGSGVYVAGFRLAEDFATIEYPDDLDADLRFL